MPGHVHVIAGGKSGCPGKRVLDGQLRTTVTVNLAKFPVEDSTAIRSDREVKRLNLEPTPVFTRILVLCIVN